MSVADVAVHARDPFCPRVFTATICRDSDSTNFSNKRGIFLNFRTAHSGHALREGARGVRDNLGHANVVVTQYCQQAKGEA